MSKDYKILVLAMSSLPNPLNAFQNRYVFKDDNGVSSKIYHGLGQLEPVPQYILETYGAITHYVILETEAVKLTKNYDWDKINEKIKAEGDEAALEYTPGEAVSTVGFFKKRVDAFHRMRNFNQPTYVDVDFSDDDPEPGFANLLKSIRTLYAQCKEENKNRNIDDCWQLFVDVHGGLRDASFVLFSLIHNLSAPDEQDLSQWDNKINSAIARLTDGKGTVPVERVFTIAFDPTGNNEKPHTILDRTKLYEMFIRESLEAYMNYGQYAGLALKSDIDLGAETIPPYAFISYRRLDAPKERFAFLGILKKEGYLYWYDDAIDLQADWTTVLENANNKSTVFIALITAHYFESYQCVKELRQALDEKETIEEEVSRILLVSTDGTPLYPPIEGDLTVTDEQLHESVTIKKAEFDKLTEVNHCNIGSLMHEGVFDKSQLLAKLMDLCEKN
ncbi:MAG: toll/interleukin-1 receptor domain-containing protein, partial [Acutalibacteraceae bacterium]